VTNKTGVSETPTRLIITKIQEMVLKLGDARHDGCIHLYDSNDRTTTITST
jgi:hypothetical protein